jgi:hypothetical protein
MRFGTQPLVQLKSPRRDPEEMAASTIVEMEMSKSAASSAASIRARAVAASSARSNAASSAHLKQAVASWIQMPRK